MGCLLKSMQAHKPFNLLRQVTSTVYQTCTGHAIETVVHGLAKYALVKALYCMHAAVGARAEQHQ
jgi:hypothetical protein